VNVYDLETCNGDFRVEVTMTTDDPNFQFIGCANTEGNIWTCACNNPSSLEFLPAESSPPNEFDFMIQYYLGENHTEAAKRVYSVNNIAIVSKELKVPKKSVAMPAFSGGIFIVGVIIIILIIIGVVIYYAIKWLMKDPPGSDEYIAKENHHNLSKAQIAEESKSADEEIDEIMKGLE